MLLAVLHRVMVHRESLKNTQEARVPLSNTLGYCLEQILPFSRVLSYAP